MYFGLSDAQSHVDVARRLLPRRGQIYEPGTVAVRPGSAAPILYVAVRDPSAVRVIPAPVPRDEHADAPHVWLHFPSGSDANVLAIDSPFDGAAGAAVRRYAASEPQAGFVVTIGLRSDRETEFHQRVIVENPGLPFGDLCERITAIKGEFVD